VSEPEEPAERRRRLITRLDPDRARSRPEAESPEETSSSKEGARKEAPPPKFDPTFGGRAGRGPAGREPTRPSPIDTRRYRWAIGIFGLALVVAISIYQFATHGVGSTGVPPGQRLHWFAAPLANTTLRGSANLHPPCTLARHDPRALNICLISSHEPLVLSLFVASSSDCVSQVDALQQISRDYRPGQVQFAAVALNGGQRQTAQLIRSHHWTIPVAYDEGGSVGGLYGVALCPMAELAYRGGIVRARLIGDQWRTAAQLAPEVRALVRSRGPAR
jgi:hypothetical protein